MSLNPTATCAILPWPSGCSCVDLGSCLGCPSMSCWKDLAGVASRPQTSSGRCGGGRGLRLGCQRMSCWCRVAIAGSTWVCSPSPWCRCWAGFRAWWSVHLRQQGLQLGACALVWVCGCLQGALLVLCRNVGVEGTLPRFLAGRSNVWICSGWVQCHHHASKSVL